MKVGDIIAIFKSVVNTDREGSNRMNFIQPELPFGGGGMGYRDDYDSNYMSDYELQKARDAIRENMNYRDVTVPQLEYKVLKKDEEVKALTKERDSLKTKLDEALKKTDPVEIVFSQSNNSDELMALTKKELVAQHILLLADNANLLEKLENNIENVEDDCKMMNFKNMFGEFGKVTTGDLAMTMTGCIAVRRSEGEFVRYDADSEQMQNMMDLVLSEASDFIYIMPVMTVSIGDIIKFKNNYCQVLKINANGSLRVVNIKTGTKTTILKEVNVFGMSFWYKVACLFNMDGNSTVAGMNPMMLMMFSGDDKEGSTSKDKMLEMMMIGSMFSGMQPQGAAQANPMMNPMMMAMMMGGKGDDKMSTMATMMMAQSMMGGGMNMFGMQQPQPKVTKKVVEEKVEENINEDDSEE